MRSRRERAGAQRLDDIAGFVQRRLGIDKDAGAADGIVVGLAHVRAIGADQVEMRAGFEPRAPHQRLGRQRGAGDDVGGSGGLGEIGYGDGGGPGSGKARGQGGGLGGSRPQMRVSRIGRTAACAAIRYGASAPVPTIRCTALSSRARKPAASAEAAAVRRRVSAVPSSTALGTPVAASSSR